jgi:hypothetical protein
MGLEPPEAYPACRSLSSSAQCVPARLGERRGPCSDLQDVERDCRYGSRRAEDVRRSFDTQSHDVGKERVLRRWCGASCTRHNPQPWHETAAMAHQL